MVKCNMSPEEQDRALALFPPAPSTDELIRSRHYFRKYLFYDTRGRKNFREYFCPSCGRFEIEGPYNSDIYTDDPFSHRHNDRAPCPICRDEFALISIGRAGEMKKLTNWAKIAFIRNAGGVLTISAGEAGMIYSPEDLLPLPIYLEKMRYVVEPGKRQAWRCDDWYIRDGRRSWSPTKTFYEPWPRTHWLLWSGIHGEVGFIGAENIRDTSMRYCQLAEWLNKAFGAGIDDLAGGIPFRGAIEYLGEYSAHPQLEMLVKLGHEDVVTELIERGSLPRGLINWRAKTPAGFFRMSKTEYRQFVAAGGDWKALQRWRKDASDGIQFAEYMAICEKMPETAKEFFSACKELGTDVKKSFAYLRAQSPKALQRLDKMVYLWRDYLDMARKLERNMAFKCNQFPERLREEHDAAVAQVQYAEQLAEEKAYGKRYRQLRKRYEYASGGLRIVVPGSSQEIVREGKALQHCVGGYAERHVKGATTILFLRRDEAPGESYVTVEINDADHKIRQAHGYRNEADGAKRPLERHREFFDEWLEWLKRGSPRTRKGAPIRPRKTKMEEKTA